MSDAPHRLLVFSEPVAGREDEYHRWYDEVHIGEVLQVDGFVACQRFAAQPDEGRPAPAGFLAVYEIDAEDPLAAYAGLQQSVGEMTLTDALDRDSVRAWVYSATGPRRARD